MKKTKKKCHIKKKKTYKKREHIKKSYKSGARLQYPKV